MLISFVVENFRSFDVEQEFSMVANTRQTNLGRHLTEIEGVEERILPVAAIYGANGSGKSNLVRALGWLRNMVSPRSLRFRWDPFLFAASNRSSRLELRFLSYGQVLQYGLTFGAKGFQTEWLSKISLGGREKIIFERKTDSDGQTEIEFGKELEGSPTKLDALRVLGVRPTELMLARMPKELSEAELPPLVRSANAWFSRLWIVGADTPYNFLTDRLHDEEAFRAYASWLLHRVDPTISAVRATTKTMPIEDLPLRIRTELAEIDPGEEISWLGRPLVKVDENSVAQREVQLEHLGPEGVRKPLDFAQESDGSKRLIHMAPAAFDAAEFDVVVVIDELDRSLHALLAREFVEEFLRRAQGHHSQLIFTTHETHVLDQELLRRDEVWFVEKNEHGGSELHSLDDFPIRNDLRLDRSYIQGRFGGVPRFNGDQ